MNWHKIYSFDCSFFFFCCVSPSFCDDFICAALSRFLMLDYLYWLVDAVHFAPGFHCKCSRNMYVFVVRTGILWPAGNENRIHLNAMHTTLISALILCAVCCLSRYTLSNSNHRRNRIYSLETNFQFVLESLRESISNEESKKILLQTFNFMHARR